LIRQSHTGAAAPPAAIRSAVCAVDRRFTTVRFAKCQQRLRHRVGVPAVAHRIPQSDRPGTALRQPGDPAAHRRAATATAGSAHHLHVVALGAADNVQQTRLAGPTYPHAHRVVTAVQRAHRWFQRDTVLRGGQRIPVGAHHDAFTATAPYPIPAVTVAADSALPYRTGLGARSAHHQRLEPRQFLGVHPRIDQQP